MSNNTADILPLITLNDSHPPLASPEIDDLGDEAPKIDDAKNDSLDGDHSKRTDDRDKNTEDEDDDDYNTNFDSSRFSPEGELDEGDGVKIGERAGFPYAPDFGPGNFDVQTLPDLNEYQQKKTLAKGMMDLALFSANANQLRYVLESSIQHPYYYPSIVFISFSLLMQVAIGVGLVWNALYNVKKDEEMHTANKINNFTTIGIFLVTVVNVFICSFGVVNGTALKPLVNATTTTT